MMTALTAHHEPATPPAIHSWFDLAIEVLLIAQLAFMPFAFGAVEAWSELVVIALVGSLALFLLLKSILHPDFRFRGTIAFVPIILFLVMAGVQLIPMPAGIASVLSPQALELRKQLLGGFVSSTHNLDWMTLSLYPLLTRHDLRLVLIASTLFVVVLNVYRTRAQIMRLLLAIGCIGAMVAVLALAQILTHARAIYWSVPVDQTANGGPFVSHTHFGQFMNLSIGATLGLALMLFYDRSPVDDGRRRRRWGILIALIFILLLDAAALVLSLTRGGIVGMIGAAVVIGLLLAWRRGVARVAIIVVVSIAVLGVVIYPWINSVAQRVSATPAVARDRLRTVKDCAAACAQFPLFGTGLGTHEFVFPIFDRSFTGGLSTFAENEYAQVAEELGVPGLALVLFIVAIVGVAFFQVIRRLARPVDYVVFGLGYGLLAVMIHSFGDFGQHIPAIFCISAIFCALILNRKRGDEPSPASKDRRRQGQTILRVCALLAACAIVFWACVETNTARRAESLWANVLHQENSLRRQDWGGSPQAYRRLIASAEQLTTIQPENVTYRHWLNVYRWRSASSSRRESAKHKVEVDGQVLAQAQAIVRDFQETLWLCPTFSPTWLFMGQLEYNILRLPQGADHIRTGYGLNKCDANACEVVGALAVKQGDWKLAVEAYRGSADWMEAKRYLLDRAHRPDLLLAAEAGKIEELLLIIPELSASPKGVPYAKEARRQAMQMLEKEEKASDRFVPDIFEHSRRLAELAELRLQDGRYEEAVKLYERAFSARIPVAEWVYTPWRFPYAQALIHLNRLSEAKQQLRLALKIHPDWKEARDLLDSLEAKPK